MADVYTVQCQAYEDENNGRLLDVCATVEKAFEVAMKFVDHPDAKIEMANPDRKSCRDPFHVRVPADLETAVEAFKRNDTFVSIMAPNGDMYTEITRWTPSS